MILRRINVSFMQLNILYNRANFYKYSQLLHETIEPERDRQREKANLRIGRAIRNIPEDYRHFFMRPGSDVIDFAPYDTNCKLIFHVENIVMNSKTSTLSPSMSVNAAAAATTANLIPNVLEIEGKRAMRLFMWRIRFLWKWGHLFWIMSDWQALKMEPIRIINPSSLLTGHSPERQHELKIYWRLSIDPNRAFLIENNKMSLKSMYKVQMARFFDSYNIQNCSEREQKKSPIILLNGLNRYIFDVNTGYCTEFHIDSVEPKIDQSKWTMWFENYLSEPSMV